MHLERETRSTSGFGAGLRRILPATLCTLALGVAPAGAEEPGATEHGGLGEVGAKLADPTSNIWSMQAVLEAPAFFDGDLNTGEPEVGSSLTLQPVMPLPLYGQGEDQWKLITRPVLPVIFSQPVPRGFNSFYDKGGLGDMTLPILPTPPTRYLKTPGERGQWILAAGPTWYFPTATDDALGTQQFGVGPGLALGYKNELVTAVVFPQWWWGIGEFDRDDDTPHLNQMAMLYALTFNLPDAWQIGLNPTITYDRRADSDDRLTLPVGLFGARTFRIGRMPLNLRVGLEYSVVSPDTYGKRVGFRFQITPVIPSLVADPIFGDAN